MKQCKTCRHRGDLPLLLTSRGLTGHGVEVGVRKGEFSEIVLSRWPGFLHLVDPWRSDLPEYVDSGWSEWDNEVDYAETLRRLEPYVGRYMVHKCTSTDALRTVPGNLDFAYVDANHAYNFVWTDLRVWYDKLRPGGMLSGHDMFYWELPGVTKAVVEFAVSRDLTVHLIPGSTDNACRDGQVMSWYLYKE